MPNAFDIFRQRSDYRRWQGRGNLFDALFLHLRSAWIMRKRRHERP